MFTGKLGKNAPIQNAKMLKLGNYLLTNYPAVASIDYTTAVTMGWQMMCNDTLGCCTIAAVGHMGMAYSAIDKDVPIRVMTDNEVKAYYQIIDGWNPANSAATDNGGYCQNVLNYWKTNGIRMDTYVNNILGWVSVDVQNIAEVRCAIRQFGGLYTGFALPSNALTTLDWTVSTTATIAGGHCVPIMAMDDSNNFKAITWGQVATMNQQFLQTYCDEAYAIVDVRFFNPDGINQTQLVQDLSDY